MFLNTSKLKKFMKQAFGVGKLKIGHISDKFYIGMEYMAVEFEENYIPNAIKGYVIELCGELPVYGQLLECGKEGNQQVIPDTYTYLSDSYMMAKSVLVPCKVTAFHGYTEYTLYQFVDSKLIIPVARPLTDAIDLKEIDTAVENIPGNPSAIKENEAGEILYWHNGIMTLAIVSAPTKMIKKEVTDALVGIDFSEEE